MIHLARIAIFITCLYAALDEAQVKGGVFGCFSVLILGRCDEGGEPSPIIKDRISF